MTYLSGHLSAGFMQPGPVDWMADWLTSRLTDWLTDWQTDCLIVWLSHVCLGCWAVLFTLPQEHSCQNWRWIILRPYYCAFLALANMRPLFCLWLRFCQQIAKRWKKWMIDRQAKANMELCFSSPVFILSGSCYPTAPSRASDSSEWKFLEGRKRETEEVLRMY